MRKITNIVSSVTYYKKNNFLLFGVYAVTLFSLGTIQLLIISQTAKRQHITERWELFAQILPKQQTSNFGSFLTADSLLRAKYELIVTIILALVFVLLTGLTGSLVFRRRHDIRSFLSLGLKKSKIISQLLLEALLPLFFSFIAVVTFLLIFQLSFRNCITITNDRLFANELPTELRALEGHPLITNKESQNLAQGNGELILPFNAKLFYQSDTLNDSFSYVNLLKVFSRTFLFLIVFCLVITCPITLLAVQLIGR